MSIELDHTIVPAHDRDASAQRLAQLLGVPCGRAAAGPFYAVYLNDGLTLDFIQTSEPFEAYHFAFRVDDAILGRLREAGIAYRGNVHGPMDNSIATWDGGRMLYWNDPEDHQWEILTVSYARAPKSNSAG